MEEVGQVREIVRDLFSPSVVGSNGKKRHRILAGPPGGKSGQQSAAGMHALEQHGITPQHFDTIYGCSASAWNSTAYCAGRAYQCAKVYEQLCDMPFLFHEWWNGAWLGWMQGEWLNLQYLHDLLASHGLDDAPRDEWPELLIGVSDLDGRHHFLRGKDPGSVLARCRASSSVLPFTSGTHADGGFWVDGGHAHPCPLRDLVKDIHARDEEVDVLILANRPHPRHMSYFEWFVFQSTVLAWLPMRSWSLYENTRQFDDKIARVARTAGKRRSWIRIGMLFPEPHDATLQFEWRKPVVRMQYDKAYLHMALLLQECKPARQI